MSILIRRLSNLPGALALFIEAWVRLGLARFAIKRGTFRNLHTPWGVPMYETFRAPHPDRATAIRISRAIERASRVTPWVSNCLPQAMTAKQMLQKRGLRSTLYLGLATDKNGKILAHAWLRCGAFYVTGGRGQGFTVVGAFAESDDPHAQTASPASAETQSALNLLKNAK